MSRLGMRFCGALCLVILVPNIRLQGQATVKAQPATLRVLLPQDNAILTIQNGATRQTGNNRLFQSPPLPPGKEYVYTVVAVWEPNNYTKITRTREVLVQ